MAGNSLFACFDLALVTGKLHPVITTVTVSRFSENVIANLYKINTIKHQRLQHVYLNVFSKEK